MKYDDPHESKTTHDNFIKKKNHISSVHTFLKDMCTLQVFLMYTFVGGRGRSLV